MSARARAATAPPGASGAASWQVAAGLGVVYVVWGSTYLAIRIMVETVPPLLGAGLRFSLAGSGLLAIIAVRRGVRAVRVPRRELLGAALVGVLLAAGGNGLVTVAERHIASSLAALLIASVPLWVVLLRRLGGEHVGPRTLLGVAIGFVGVGVLLLPGRPHGAALGGVILCLVAATSWATGSFTSTRLRLPRDPLVSTGFQMLCGGAAMLPAGLLAGEAHGLHLEAFSVRSGLAFAYLVLIGSGLAYTAYAWLLQNAPISQVATYAYVNPVVAVVLGRVVLDEPVPTSTLLGAAIVVASVAFIVRQQAPVRPAPA